MVGAEGMKIFDFDNTRLLEKALSGTELHRKLLPLLKALKLLLQNVEEILFEQIFLGAHTGQTVSKNLHLNMPDCLNSFMPSGSKRSYIFRQTYNF